MQPTEVWLTDAIEASVRRNMGVPVQEAQEEQEVDPGCSLGGCQEVQDQVRVHPCRLGQEVAQVRCQCDWRMSR